MTTPAPSPGWALRVHAACDWVLWAMTINVLWWVFTAAGGVLLGAAPATVAAVHLTRRRLRGEAFPTLREFTRLWKAEFLPANAVIAPPLLVTALLAVQVAGSAASGALAQPVGLLFTAAAVVSFLITAIVAPLYANYDLPLRAYLPTASRWMLQNLAHDALLVVAAVAVVAASLMLPGLIPFVSVGAWLALSTALCLGFFAANDRLVAERSALPSLTPQ